MATQPSSDRPPQRFDLTPRQRRLRSVTLVILLFIAGMIIFATLHPFFHPVRPPVMTERVRKALALQGLFILGYYSICFLLALSLVVIAWLYARDIRLQLLIAQRDMWREISRREKSREDESLEDSGESASEGEPDPVDSDHASRS